MERQLVLLDENPPEWRIDDETRAIGQAGIAEARRALQEALQRAGGSQRSAA
jgi:hypothetical protein